MAGRPKVSAWACPSPKLAGTAAGRRGARVQRARGLPADGLARPDRSTPAATLPAFLPWPGNEAQLALADVVPVVRARNWADPRTVINSSWAEPSAPAQRAAATTSQEPSNLSTRSDGLAACLRRLPPLLITRYISRRNPPDDPLPPSAHERGLGGRAPIQTDRPDGALHKVNLRTRALGEPLPFALSSAFLPFRPDTKNPRERCNAPGVLVGVNVTVTHDSDTQSLSERR